MNSQCGQPKVYIFAKKILRINTRIFKQAKSLVDAGYDVTVVGIQADGLPAREIKDGYVILRVERKPLPSLIKMLKSLLGKLPWRTKRDVRESRLAWLVGLCGLAWRRLAGWLRAWLWLRTLQRVLERGIARVRQRIVVALRWPISSLNYSVRAYSLFREDPVPPDIIHANDLDALPVGVWAAKSAKAKLVYDAQELYSEVHTLPPLYRRLLRIQEHVLIRKPDRVIAVNEFIAQEMERRYHVPINAVILNCPPFEDLTNATTGCTIRDRLAIPDEEPILLYSGGLSPLRGIENTLLAVQFLERGVLILLGDGNLQGKLETLATEHGLSHRVHFVDYIPHQEVPLFISSADVGIIPYEMVGLNHYYCSPSKLFHYIMAELPVVGSDFPFLRKVILENDIGTTFDPQDPRSIAKAVEAVVADGVRYRSVKANLRRVKRHYCWQNEERKFLDLYESLNVRVKG